MYSPIKGLYMFSIISRARNSPTETQEKVLPPTACHFLICSADVTAS